MSYRPASRPKTNAGARISGECNEASWTPGPRRALPLGSSLSQNDTSSSFEQLALPLLDSAYNFAYWLAQNRDNAEDLVQETYLKALRGFSSVSARQQFSSMVVSNLEEHLPYFVFRSKTRLDSSARFRRGSAPLAGELN